MCEMQVLHQGLPRCGPRLWTHSQQFTCRPLRSGIHQSQNILSFMVGSILLLHYKEATNLRSYPAFKSNFSLISDRLLKAFYAPNYFNPNK